MSKFRLTSSRVETVRLAANRVCNEDSSDRWDSVTSASAFLDLTDPAPLTVHSLVSRGVKLRDDSSWIYVLSGLTIYPDGPADVWDWKYEERLLPKWLKPVNEGELTSLLLKLEKT